MAMHARCDWVWIPRKEWARSSADQERAEQTIAGKAASEKNKQQQQQQHHLRSAEEYSNRLRKRPCRGDSKPLALSPTEYTGLLFLYHEVGCLAHGVRRVTRPHHPIS